MILILETIQEMGGKVSEQLFGIPYETSIVFSFLLTLFRYPHSQKAEALDQIWLP